MSLSRKLRVDPNVMTDAAREVVGWMKQFHWKEFVDLQQADESRQRDPKAQTLSRRYQQIAQRLMILNQADRAMAIELWLTHAPDIAGVPMFLASQAQALEQRWYQVNNAQQRGSASEAEALQIYFGQFFSQWSQMRYNLKFPSSGKTGAQLMDDAEPGPKSFDEQLGALFVSRPPPIPILPQWQPKVIDEEHTLALALCLKRAARLLQTFDWTNFSNEDLDPQVVGRDSQAAARAYSYIALAAMLYAAAQLDIARARLLWAEHVPSAIGVIGFLHPENEEREMQYHRESTRGRNGEVVSVDVLLNPYAEQRMLLKPFGETLQTGVGGARRPLH